MLADAATGEVGRAMTLRRWWAVAGLTLFGATWKLWIPQTEFPQVPLFGWAGSLPPFLGWLGFGVLLGSLVIASGKPDLRQSWLAFVVSMCVLIALDQHRLQPWAWQLMLMAICWSSANVGQVFNLPSGLKNRQVENLPHVLLTITIYFWSAVSKFDGSFFLSHGQTLVDAFFQAIGLKQTPGDAPWKFWYAHLLPVGELLVAAGLCWTRTRRLALFAATVMHVGLMLALGPTGLGHRPGVLLWNVAFIGHDWLLFGRRANGDVRPARSASEGATSPSSLAPSLARRASLVLVLFACVWPITEQWGLCDHWLAWSLYSARSERVTIMLTNEGLRCLPESARPLASDDELRLDRWSLAALDAPIYPQLRFQCGVVEWLRQRCGDENLVLICISPAPDGSGHTLCLTVEQFDEQRRAFWINTSPRDASLAGNRR